MSRTRRLYILGSVIGFVLLIVPNAIGVAAGGSDPGFLYLAFFWVLLWLLVGAMLVTAAWFRRAYAQRGT